MSTAPCNAKPYEDTFLKARLEGVRSVIASARLEGVEITASTQDVLGEYGSGTIDGDEMMDRVLAVYGPGA